LSFKLFQLRKEMNFNDILTNNTYKLIISVLIIGIVYFIRTLVNK
jgi:hypothetical protein